MRDPGLTHYAKQMRKRPSEAEERLWFALRARRLNGVKFRRQKVVGSYIVDFASRYPMLAIEVDGDTHADRESYDATRTSFLEGQGYQVIRFSNDEVVSNLEGVLERLRNAVTSPPPPTPSPEGEGA
jgi:very-short-patch-repair endonuclease